MMHISYRILVCGLRGSGSTWLFNAIRLALLQSGCSVQGHMGTPANYPKSGVQLFKLHSYVESYQKTANLIFTTRRDLRNVATTMARRGIVQNNTYDIIAFLTEEVKNYLAWKPYSDMEVVYEKMMTDQVTTISDISKILGIKSDANKVVEEIAKLQVPQAGVDPVTMLWHDHRTNNKFKLTPRCLDAITDHFAYTDLLTASAIGHGRA